jgi:glycosyltransferase involved in cell wall biosynthesis/peptidoglycan/xylan/chitin deacetylase (PgdA/CDA1 family)
MATNLRKKRILMILENQSFPEDTRVLLEALALHEAGYEVTVICPTGTSRKKFEWVRGIRVYRYPEPFEPSGVLGYLFEYGYSMAVAGILASWCSIRHGFDAIHIHCPPDMNVLVGIPFRWIGKKLVIDLHDLSPELFAAKRNKPSQGILGKALLFFERLACQSANALIATNETQRDVQLTRGGARPDLCYVVRNGPNKQFTSLAEPLSGLKKQGEILVGFVGAIGVQDTVENFVYVIDKIRQRRSDIRGIIVGGGPAFEQVRQVAKELQLDDWMTFTGPVEFAKVPSHIAAFDICVTPDSSNPYNDSCTTIKTMEYMALERPTVAFDTKENRRTAGASALYAQNNDLDQFAALIEKLADDPQLRKSMGKEGRRLIDEKYSWDKQKLQLQKVYRDLLYPESKTKLNSLIHDTSANQPAVPIALHPNLEQPSKITESIQQDIANAKLSSCYQCFYRVRPLIPTAARQWLQKRRNRKLGKQPNWYLPTEIADYSTSQHSLSIWPNLAEYSLVLTHDVESADGMRMIPQLAEIENKLGLKSCWNIVPFKYKIDRGLLDDLVAQGHEIGIHGYNHDGRLFSSYEEFMRRVPAINRALEDYQAVGFRAPMVHRNLRWMQQLNIEYDASCFDIDPFQAMPGGCGSIWPFMAGKFVELPYTLPQDHTLFVVMQQNDDQIWRNKLQFIRQHHGMALMLTHPDYLSSLHKLDIYRRFLSYILESGTPWHVTPLEMSRWFRSAAHVRSEEKSRLGEPFSVYSQALPGLCDK